MTESAGTNHIRIGNLDRIEAAISRGGTKAGIMDRIVAVLHADIDVYTWVGFYLMDGEELVLGPFRGQPSPHTRITLDSGICGAAALQKKTVIVPDVNADPRYLACSPATRSEIVVPIMDGARCLGEIDVDSDQVDAFGPADREFLEAIAERMVGVLRAG